MRKRGKRRSHSNDSSLRLTPFGEVLSSPWVAHRRPGYQMGPPEEERAMTTVYKVVRRRWDGKLASAMMSDSKLEVIYKPSKKAHSLDGMKLLALKT